MKDINRQNKNTKNTKNTLPATFLNLAATATKTNTKLHFAGLQSFKQGKTISFLYGCFRAWALGWKRRCHMVNQGWSKTDLWPRNLHFARNQSCKVWNFQFLIWSERRYHMVNQVWSKNDLSPRHKTYILHKINLAKADMTEEVEKNILWASLPMHWGE